MPLSTIILVRLNKDISNVKQIKTMYANSWELKGKALQQFHSNHVNSMRSGIKYSIN
jgi:hypothetical protein